MANLDEQLQAATEADQQRQRSVEDEQRRQEFEQQQQQDRLIQQQQEEQDHQNQSGGLQSKATNALKQQGKKIAKKAIWQGIKASAPYWGPPLALIILGAALLLIVIMVPIAVCKSSVDGIGTAAAKATLTAAGVCSAFNGGKDGGGGGGASFGTLDIAITGAYRPGSVVTGTGRLSAHSRGEAVDIALRNPKVPEHGTDPRIAQLVAIGKSAGFNPLAGDTLDEYTTPTEGASAGHIHVEFNLKPDGKTYCDGATIPASGPTDLVPIPSSIPVDGASDPRLRPCMLAAVQNIFNAAK